MAFIRIKRISGSEYGYLVANSWTSAGPRQKVAKYLGKVLRPQKARTGSLAAFLGLPSDEAVHQWVGTSSFTEIAAALMAWELGNHELDASHTIAAEKAEFLDGKGRPLVLAVNDGFLCSHTARQLLDYDAGADYSGYNLADALTAAGIAVDKNVFISLYGKLQATVKQEHQIDAAKDFYY